MLNAIAIYCLGGLACGLTSFLIGTYFKRPESTSRRLLYASISGVGSIAICWLACKYFPNKFDIWDSVPYSILIGFFGIGRVLDWIAKKYGYETNIEKIDHEQ